jgi:Ca2+-binding EF-hand superfamily protein
MYTNREDIARVFRLFDADGKGRINVSDLRRVARELGEPLTDAEVGLVCRTFYV